MHQSLPGGHFSYIVPVSSCDIKCIQFKLKKYSLFSLLGEAEKNKLKKILYYVNKKKKTSSWEPTYHIDR